METSRRSVGRAVRFPDADNIDSRQQQRTGREPSSRRRVSNDDCDLETRKHIAQMQEELLLLHQTVMASKKQQIEAQHERAREMANTPSLHIAGCVLPRFQRDAPLSPIVEGLGLAARCVCRRRVAALSVRVWLFRYVLTFLRDGILPQDPKLLRELYLENEFWTLESLRRAIEMRNMELLQIKQESDAVAAMLLSSGMMAKAGVKPGSASLLGRLKAAAADPPSLTKDTKYPNAWWLDPPLWWGGGGGDNSKADKEEGKPPAKVSAFASILKKKPQTEAENVATAAANESDAWWKSTTYKGVDFAEGLSSPEKKQQQSQQQADTGSEDVPANEKTTPRVPLVVNTTWASSHHLSE